MDKKIITRNEVRIAVIHSEEVLLHDTSSALDLIATVSYSDNCDRMCINKPAISEDFFRLSSGIAGEILQKFVNYSTKLAIIGDFSQYDSEPLKDFIYECNKSSNIFFVQTVSDALERLSVI